MSADTHVAIRSEDIRDAVDRMTAAMEAQSTRGGWRPADGDGAVLIADAITVGLARIEVAILRAAKTQR